MKFTIAVSLAALLGSVTAAPVARAVHVPGDDSTLVFDDETMECRDYSNPEGRFAKILICRPEPSAIPFYARPTMPDDTMLQQIDVMSYDWKTLFQKMCPDFPDACEKNFPEHEEYQRSVTFTKWPKDSSSKYADLIAPLSDDSWISYPIRHG